MQSLLDSKVPYILFDRVLPSFATHFVGTDDVAAGSIATEHLLSINRRRIAHIGNAETSNGADRLRGYRDALQKAGIPFKENLVINRSRLEESGDRVGYAGMKALLKLRKRPDAVFCYNDLTAIGAIKCVLAAGLRVPNDVAVIGCGNLRLAEYLEVPLSSLDQDTVELGEQAAKLTSSLLSGGSRPGLREIRVEPKLIVRASTIAGAGDPSAR